jgi:tetratricopeptide (TPR) repeat protein
MIHDGDEVFSDTTRSKTNWTILTRAQLIEDVSRGKTRLAIEYAHRYGQYYEGGIFWINAASGDIDLEYWGILRALVPTVPDIATMRVQGRHVAQELARALQGISKPALYIVDNIPEAAPGQDPPRISDFCPAPGAVTVLATSRQDSKEDGVHTIQIGTLERAPAILLLTDSVPNASGLCWKDWGQVAEWVGDLPIALDLLNRSLALGSVSPRWLLSRVDSQIPSARAAGELDQLRQALKGQVPANAVRGVTEAFMISIEKLDRDAKSVATVLAQLAPTPIPEEFIEALTDVWGNIPAIRAALHSRHFVTAYDGRTFGVMHRLMADVLRTLSGEQAIDFLRAACGGMVLQVMTSERCHDPRQWTLMNLCSPHAEMLFLRGISLNKAGTVAASEAGLAVAVLALSQGDYSRAWRLGERVLDVRTRILGKEHPDTLRTMNNLAAILLAQGDTARARSLGEQALESSSRLLGEEHPDTVAVMGNLVVILLALGDRAGARHLGERTVELRKQRLGEEHPETLTAISNLAGILEAQGDRVGATRLQERVLELSARVLGEEHPLTLTAMSNLAETLRIGSDHARARPLHEHVLEVRKRVLGEEHPDTLTSMNNLALTFSGQGHDTEARQLGERVLNLRTRVVGDEHPSTLRAMNNLALTLSAQRDYRGARRLAERSGRRDDTGTRHRTSRHAQIAGQPCRNSSEPGQSHGSAPPRRTGTRGEVSRSGRGTPGYVGVDQRSCTDTRSPRRPCGGPPVA